jgi:hypothetical protein
MRIGALEKRAHVGTGNSLTDTRQPLAAGRHRGRIGTLARAWRDRDDGTAGKPAKN